MRRRKLGRVMISNINLIVTTNPQDGSFRWRMSNIHRGPERKMLGKFCSFLGFTPRWRSCRNSWCLYSFMNRRLWYCSEKDFNFFFFKRRRKFGFVLEAEALCLKACEGNNHFRSLEETQRRDGYWGAEPDSICGIWTLSLWLRIMGIFLAWVVKVAWPFLCEGCKLVTISSCAIASLCPRPHFSVRG